MTDPSSAPSPALAPAAEYVAHRHYCPAIGGNGDADCACGAVAFLAMVEGFAAERSDLQAQVAQHDQYWTEERDGLRARVKFTESFEGVLLQLHEVEAQVAQLQQARSDDQQRLFHAEATLAQMRAALETWYWAKITVDEERPEFSDAQLKALTDSEDDLLALIQKLFNPRALAAPAGGAEKPTS